MTFEEKARAAWARWGDRYALFTRCSCCGEVRHCRGRRRGALLCLDCFDQKA